MHEVICSGVPAAKLWLENFFEELEEDGESPAATSLPSTVHRRRSTVKVLVSREVNILDMAIS